MTSIRSYLNVALAISLLVVFTLQWLLVSVAARQLAESYLVGRLEHDVDSLLAGLSLDSSGPATLRPDRVGLIYQRPFSGHYFRVSLPGTVIRSRSLWDQDLPVVKVAAGESDRRRINGPQEQSLVLLTKGFEQHGQFIAISVAEDLTPLLVDIRHLTRNYALVSLAALLALLVIQGFIVRRGMKPLTALGRDLTRLEHGEISTLPERVPREVLPLVRELNRLLGALHRRLRRSRQALGNLAHALKVPLILLTNLSEAERSSVDANLRDQINRHTDSIRRLIDRELKRARVAGADSPGQRLDLVREMPVLVATLGSIYRHKGLEVACDLPKKVELHADREDIFELLGNLLDNAYKWARRRVSIRVTSGPPVIISIDDDGPGCPPEQFADLARRGLRLDEAQPGHGLGLAIAKDIVESYGGTLEFSHSASLGGFRVQVTLR